MGSANRGAAMYFAVQFPGGTVHVVPEATIVLPCFAQFFPGIGADKAQAVVSGQACIHGGKPESGRIFDRIAVRRPAPQLGAMQVDYMQPGRMGQFRQRIHRRLGDVIEIIWESGIEFLKVRQKGRKEMP